MADRMIEASARPTVLQTAGMLVAIIVAVAIYATLCSAVSVALIHGGFLFLFYWAGMRAAARAELVPSLIGALGGTGLAWLVIVLPGQMGAGGYAIIGVAVLAAIFMMIRGHCPLLINNAFMLYLTVFTIPGAVAPGHYPQVVASVLIAGGLSFIAMAVGQKLAARGGSVPEVG
ncbi:MAG TPA: hypothetical protein VF503_07530 [Sphingobium sp.]|uniref:hypothetical protein n=1 Tax=Sphingobium sp. TaxID=1912891 RepID=UPI002ED56E19